MDQARAVIIGGGVGGTSIAYHLAERGWRDILLVDRAELTSGSTFHSAGLVGQLRSSVTLTRMMMDSVDLYRRLKAETGTDPAGTRSVRCASRRRPARMEELRRQAGWAKTFGLPLELIGPAEARRSLPADVARRRPRRRLPADRRLARPVAAWPSPSPPAPGPAARAIETGTRVVAIGIDGRPGHAASRSSTGGERRTIRRPVVVNAGGMFAPEIGRLVGVNVPIIPMAHEYLFTERIDGVTAEPADDARPRPPVLLPRGGRRAVHGRLRARPGALVAGRRAGRLQRQAAGPGLAALRRDHGRRRPARAARSPTPGSTG